MSIGIDHCLAPTYFISYSRKQEAVACELKGLIGSVARRPWYDRDEIMPGDRWMNEIRDGIEAADEFVLLLSNDSLASRVVEQEIRFAQERDKAIRPILVSRISGGLPDHLRELHYLDLTGVEPSQLAHHLSKFFGAPQPNASADAKMKFLACRYICPEFVAEFATTDGRLRAQSFAAQFDRLRLGHSQASTLQLNAGLMLCIVGRWDDGLELLRRYAHAANNLPGWYFLALHLPRARPVANLPLPAVKEALESIDKALCLGANPLAFLAAAVIETSGDNRGVRNLERRMDEFVDALAPQVETRAEFLRACWCLAPSLEPLGYGEPLNNLIRGMKP